MVANGLHRLSFPTCPFIIWTNTSFDTPQFANVVAPHCKSCCPPQVVCILLYHIASLAHSCDGYNLPKRRCDVSPNKQNFRENSTSHAHIAKIRKRNEKHGFFWAKMGARTSYCIRRVSSFCLVGADAARMRMGRLEGGGTLVRSLFYRSSSAVGEGT